MRDKMFDTCRIHREKVKIEGILNALCVGVYPFHKAETLLQLKYRICVDRNRFVWRRHGSLCIISLNMAPKLADGWRFVCILKTDCTDR